ncbi:MAG: response regulator [Armatimonadetes bacterium]|nr:response regulator [Armatimonadota bacterium]
MSSTEFKKTALIIDDSEINRDIISTYLEDEDYEIFSASNGLEGIEEYKANKPFITFLDIVMPKMTGLVVLEKIKAIDPKAIVVMVSSYVSRQNIQEAKDLNANWFLIKPFSRQKFSETLRKFEPK